LIVEVLTMDAYLNQTVRYLAAQSWQIAVLTAAVAAITFALRHRSAHVRYLLWLIVLAKCLVPPLYVVPLRVLPQTVPEMVPSVLSQPARSGEPSTFPNPAPLGTPSLQRSEPAPSPTVPPRSAHRLSVSGGLGIIWLIGASAYLAMNLLRALRGRYWLGRSRKALPNDIRMDAANLLPACGVGRVPRIWMMEGVGQPFVWGLLRGSIYVPPSFLAIESPAHRRDILAHELSHVVRLDAAVNTLQVIVQGLFWFHPFVWWANRKIRQEREKCCDEMAIAHLGARPKDYSTALVSTLIPAQESTWAVPSLAVAGPVKNIEERIRTMLRPGREFYKRPSLVAATIVLLLALLTVPTALVLSVKAQSKATGMSLHEAAAAGDVDQVKLLLSKGADVSEKDKEGRTPLHSAAWCGRKDVAEVLVAKGANINETDVSGQTPLHLAANFGTRFVPELLLAKGANVNARDKAGNTPLHIAAAYRADSKDFLEFLLARGADVNARNDKGETPLHLVSRTRKQDNRRELAADALLAHGADINAKDKSGCTPLHFAAENGQGKVAELLLAKGADSKAKATDGTTTLHRAVMSRRSDVVALLLDRGVDINSAQADGWTALHYSAMIGTNDIAELLISKGADVNAKTVRGETPVHLAVVQNRRDTVKLLLSKGAEVSTIQLAAYLGDLAKVKSFIAKGVSVNTQDGYWPTPLQAAAATGQREVAEFLINEGALVNAEAVAQGGTTALHYAALGGSKEMVELLISKGAVIDARDKNALKALPLAAMAGYTDIVKRFTYLRYAREVNAKDKDGWTPLHYAARSGHEDVVLLLINHGADVNAEAPDKSKPLDHATWSDHKDVVKLLIDKGTNIPKDDNLLYWSCMYGYRDLAELLIKKGADVNSKAWPNAPSLEAVWNTPSSRQLDILKLLLDNGANPNAKDRWDWSLLHYTEGDVELTRLLLDKGANPNVIENERGLTPLHLAADKGRKAMVELLLSRGADVNAKDYSGRTPLSYAEDLGDKDMFGRPRSTPLTIEAESAKKEAAELLRQHGAKE
jgi:ankyrin repeat protein/beta-lactamase regulating signal transducer with metallopeptidase domain